MPSAKDGIGVQSGQNNVSIPPPPVPTCPPPFDPDFVDNGNGLQVYIIDMIKRYRYNYMISILYVITTAIILKLILHF